MGLFSLEARSIDWDVNLMGGSRFITAAQATFASARTDVRVGETVVEGVSVQFPVAALLLLESVFKDHPLGGFNVLLPIDGVIMVSVREGGDYTLRDVVPAVSNSHPGDLDLSVTHDAASATVRVGLGGGEEVTIPVAEYAGEVLSYVDCYRGLWDGREEVDLHPQSAEEMRAFWTVYGQLRQRALDLIASRG